MTTVHFETNGAVAVVTMAKPPHNLIETVSYAICKCL